MKIVKYSIHRIASADSKSKLSFLLFASIIVRTLFFDLFYFNLSDNFKMLCLKLLSANAKHFCFSFWSYYKRCLAFYEWEFFTVIFKKNSPFLSKKGEPKNSKQKIYITYILTPASYLFQKSTSIKTYVIKFLRSKKFIIFLFRCVSYTYYILCVYLKSIILFSYYIDNVVRVIFT